MSRIIECVPNFSEGRDMSAIRRITDAIASVEHVKLLNVDPGYATHRTVVTFAGTPEAVVEAAFRAIRMAAELIDMRRHTGEHPRMGATDVCPLIPVSGVSMDEAAEYARQLGQRVGNELNIPVYAYEFSALRPERRNLAHCRSGEYEGLEAKLKQAEWMPDFGPAQFNATAGATVIGARNFLVAYNINLNTTSVRRANSIAFDVREAGRLLREGDPLTGKIITDESGKPVRKAGTLKKVKAIGWYIEEYGIAQISMNLTDIDVTPVHTAFDEVCQSATARGLRVTGSELVGLIPLQAMLDAGKHYLQKQNVSAGVSEAELIKIAIKSLGLDDLKPFDPNQRIIEYVLYANSNTPLINASLKQFADQTASGSPAPGGGSVAAYMGALAASLGAMVANLSAGKRGWDERVAHFSAYAQNGQELKKQLLALVDKDTQAFEAVMTAVRQPKSTNAERERRNQSIESATIEAIEVPLEVMRLSYKALPLLLVMAEGGNPMSVSDAGVGNVAALAAIEGAWLNVRINAGSLSNKALAKKHLTEAQQINTNAALLGAKIKETVEKKIS